MSPSDLLESFRGRLALRVGETAKLLGVSKSTIRNMCASGALPGRKIGTGKTDTYVVPVAGLLAWLDGQAEAGK